ncbi:hypothetical protein DUNSADRAFT_6092 [Dunaliella salina]|uniref:Uncharacterized protein n=1 Tax=Dunaliella salina TaxID=3046 RepID=A0ABQ7H6Y3_DUNSA|nr:hypothetical protein DUNSADRAFT_6092 [Dunaliella salina]|eukprot:KAF5842622.1 hypothetical protein DUNSADRAFT_6092 [Dunaliella salina]
MSKNVLRTAQLLLMLISIGGTAVSAADTDDKFWVFDDKGVFFVDPQSGSKQELYSNEDLCNPGEDCSNWGYPGTDGQYVVVANFNGQDPTSPGHVLAFEADSGKLVANVKSCNLPFRLDFAPWRQEVYVHCWFRPGDESSQPEDGLVDVLNTQNWGLKYPWIGAAHNSGYMHAFIALSEELKQYAWGTNMQDPGIHRIDLETREGKFFNFRDQGCTGGAGIVISDVNRHGYLKCNPRARSMVLELDLTKEEVEVVQKIEVNGTPYATEDGKYIVITDEQAHELHIFEAKADGLTNKVSVISDPNIEGFSQLAFAASDTEHVAVITSFTQNKVLLVDMETVKENPNAPGTTVVDLPDDPGHEFESTAKLGQHGGQRQLAAGATEIGQLFAMVSAQSLNQTHILEISTNPLSANLTDVDSVMGSSPKLFFMHKSEGPQPSVVTQRSSASAAQVEQLKARVAMLEEGLWGAQLSENFWVFANDGMHVIDAVRGRETHFIDGPAEGMCDGSCSWGYPETDGKSFVVVPNRGSNEVFVFDIHSGGIKARVPTCNSPYRVEPVPWANELLVHCWELPSENSFSDNSDGVVDVLSTSAWGVRNPLIDALYSSTERIHGDVIVNEALPSFAWSINFADPGVHKITMEDRTSEFMNLQSEGCFGVYNMVTSSANRHGFMECTSGSERGSPHIILEMNLEDDMVVPNPELKNLQGTPFVTKDGKFIIIMADDKLHVYEAKANGSPSAFVAEVDSSADIEGFSKLAFIQGMDGQHIAVVTSLTQNKVLVLDMDSLETNSPKTKVVTLPEDPDSSVTSTADVRDHGGGRQLSAGTMADGRMVALVSAQSMETVHVLDLGSSGSPVDAVEVTHDVEGVPGALPKMVFVPLASHEARVSTPVTSVRQQAASMGLLEAARGRMEEIESMATQEVSSLRSSMQSEMEDADQRMQELESNLATAITNMQALRKKVENNLVQQSSSDDGSGSNGGDSNSANSDSSSSSSDNDDDSRAIALAGVVLACVALAAVLVMAIVLIVAKAGSSGALDCVQQSQGSFQRFEQMKFNEYNNPANQTPVFENGAAKV